MANSRCSTCKHFGQIPQGPNQVATVCEREGPTLFAQPFPTNEGQIIWATNTMWPQVTAQNGCAHHQVDILRAN